MRLWPEVTLGVLLRNFRCVDVAGLFLSLFHFRFNLKHTLSVLGNVSEVQTKFMVENCFLIRNRYLQSQEPPYMNKKFRVTSLF